MCWVIVLVLLKDGGFIEEVEDVGDELVGELRYGHGRSHGWRGDEVMIATAMAKAIVMPG